MIAWHQMVRRYSWCERRAFPFQPSSLSAVLLNLFFNGASDNSRDAIEAAKQAEAH